MAAASRVGQGLGGLCRGGGRRLWQWGQMRAHACDANPPTPPGQWRTHLAREAHILQLIVCTVHRIHARLLGELRELALFHHGHLLGVLQDRIPPHQPQPGGSGTAAELMPGCTRTATRLHCRGTGAGCAQHWDGGARECRAKMVCGCRCRDSGMYECRYNCVNCVKINPDAPSGHV